MVKFNNKIEVLFQKIFIFNCLLQILVFHFLFIFYNINLEDVKSSVKKEVNRSVIKFREIFQKYYQQKFLYFIDDLVTIKTLFENYYNKNNYNYTEEIELFKPYSTACLTPLATLSDDKIFNRLWYEKENYETNYNEFKRNIMKGSWFMGFDKPSITDLDKQQQKNLMVLCKMNNLITKIFEKNIQWSFKQPIQLEFAHITFSDGLFYRFPLDYIPSISKQNGRTKNQNCVNYNLEQNEYFPKCREFYSQTITSDYNITITYPYIQASSGNFGTEICIRSNRPIQPEKGFDKGVSFVICFNINYNDLDSFSSQLDGVLSNKKLFIVYTNQELRKLINTVNEINISIDNDSNKNLTVNNTGSPTSKPKNNNRTSTLTETPNLVMKLFSKQICQNSSDYDDLTISTIYSSDIKSKNFFSISKKFNLTNPADNNFFDIFSFNLTAHRLNEVSSYNASYLSKDNSRYFSNKAASDFLIRSKSLFDQIERNIKCEILEKMINVYTEEKYEFTRDSNVSDLSFRFSTVDFIDVAEKNNGLPVSIDFFVFPAFIDFELKDNMYDYVKETNIFIIIAGKFSHDTLFKAFQLRILFKFILYFFFLIMFNFLLWFSIRGVIFYVFKIFFFELKTIFGDYEDLYLTDVKINIYFYCIFS